jgi:glycosyltransferase involved in cell wall biosynthesis
LGLILVGLVGMGYGKRLKVAHVQLLPILSGVQRVTLSEIRGLGGEFDYYIICKEPGPLTESAEFVPSFYIDSLTRELSPVSDFSSLIKIYRIFRTLHPDIVHTHSSKTGVLGRVAAKTARCPKVIHSVHGFAFPSASSKLTYFVYFLMEWFAKFFTDNLIVLNRDDYNIAVKKLGYKPQRVLLLPNGVDLEEFSRKNFDVGVKSRPFRVVMVGRLWTQKDPETFVRAALEVLKRHNNIVFELIGDGDLLEPLKNLVHTQGLDEHIKFSGWVDKIVDRLKAADVFVLSSLWEGMPLAILEAKAVGLPCIVTNIPGNSDLVRPGVDGYLFKTGDYCGLAEHIEKYYLDRSLVKEHGDEARKFVEIKFDLRNRLKTLSDLYM